MKKITVGIIAVLATVGLAAAPALAHPPPQPGPVPISAATQTLVTLNFTGNGCEGCVITPRQLIYASDNGGQDVSWNDDFSTQRKVRGDSVTLRVPTESTRGMYFFIDAPDSKSGAFYDAAPMVVFQYAGYSPGEWVERAQAVKASSAAPCWSGTTEASVSLTVNVRAVRLQLGSVDPATYRLPIAWVAPTEQAFGGFMGASRGLIAANGDPGCGGTS